MRYIDKLLCRKSLDVRKSKYHKLCNIFILMLILFSTLTLAGCSKSSKEEEVEEGESSIYLFYVDNNETKLVRESYSVIGSTREEKVEELIDKLSDSPKGKSYKGISSESISIERYVFEEDKRLSIYFTQDYYRLDKITEVLYRGALVKTLTQIDDIESVEFYVGGLPLTFSNDKIVGSMKNEDFIMGTGLENVVVTVYFANSKGDALVDCPLQIPSVSDMSIEQLIINILIQGPSDNYNDTNMQATIPNNTKLIKVSTKDGICYVDFSKEFLDRVSGVNDDVVIYSVVNSLIELQTINKVQFTIDGEIKKTYRDKISFDGFFERNLEIVEGTK